MSLQVGDVVEVVYVHSPEIKCWVGRRVVVSEIGVANIWGYVGIETVPRPQADRTYAPNGYSPWMPDQLRKIDPPDFQVPLVSEKETV